MPIRIEQPTRRTPGSNRSPRLPGAECWEEGVTWSLTTWGRSAVLQQPPWLPIAFVVTIRNHQASTMPRQLPAHPRDTLVTPSSLRRVPVNGVDLTWLPATARRCFLPHGFPHTWQLWDRCPRLPRRPVYRAVIAPTRARRGRKQPAPDGYDAGTLADDAEAPSAPSERRRPPWSASMPVPPPAFLLAMRRPDLVRQLVVMESLLGRLPGAEEFLAHGAPWWLASRGAGPRGNRTQRASVADYPTGSPPAPWGGWPPPCATPSCTRTPAPTPCGAPSLLPGSPTSAEQIQDAVDTGRLTVPTLAIGAHPVESPRTAAATGRRSPRRLTWLSRPRPHHPAAPPQEPASPSGAVPWPSWFRTMTLPGPQEQLSGGTGGSHRR